jgi:hypothetical protein
MTDKTPASIEMSAMQHPAWSIIAGGHLFLLLKISVMELGWARIQFLSGFNRVVDCAPKRWLSTSNANLRVSLIFHQQYRMPPHGHHYRYVFEHDHDNDHDGDRDSSR